jgi:aromatic-L-amino-acid/L-tryptophan decarboxylase
VSGPQPDRWELEPDTERMRALHDAVGGRIADWIAALPHRPADATPDAADLNRLVSAPPPEEGRPLDELLDVVVAAAEATYESAGPGYLAYVPGGGVYTAAVGEWLSQALNRYTGVAGAAPAAVALEQSVLRWMCDLFDYPHEAQGLLLSGGSMANLTALATARVARSPDSADRAVIYVGEHAHASILKAARTVGFAAANVRVVRSDERLRLRVDHLAELLRSDRRQGRRPTVVVAAAGTTNTGAVDPLDDLSRLTADERVWLHVDGAYGGLFQLTERGRRRLRGLGTADSITLDPHKTLFLPYGTGALVVRDGNALAAAFAEDADYLQDITATDAPDFNQLSPELSREWRGLRVWLPLHHHGVRAFRAQLDEKLDLAELVHDRLAADERLEVVPPDLSIVAFRLVDADDATQLDLIHRINSHGRILLSSTRFGPGVWLRVAIVSHRTHEDRIREALTLIAREVDAVAGGRAPDG